MPKHVAENDGINCCVLIRFIVILIVKSTTGMKYLERKKKQGPAGNRKHVGVMICQKLEIIRRHRWLRLRGSYGFTQYVTVNYIWHTSFHPLLYETHLCPWTFCY